MNRIPERQQHEARGAAGATPHELQRENCESDDDAERRQQEDECRDPVRRSANAGEARIEAAQRLDGLYPEGVDHKSDGATDPASLSSSGELRERQNKCERNEVHANGAIERNRLGEVAFGSDAHAADPCDHRAHGRQRQSQQPKPQQRP